jgi:hypothetical protein
MDSGSWDTKFRFFSRKIAYFEGRLSISLRQFARALNVPLQSWFADILQANGAEKTGKAPALLWSVPRMSRYKPFGGWMKTFAWMFAFAVGMSVLVRAQSAAAPAGGSESAAPQERMFFPHDTFWGWAQFDLAPPHNEIDPNLCAGNAGQYGGVNAPCSMFARYMLSGMLEARPFGRGQLRRFMVFGAPAFLMGKTIPQTLYTWSPDAIGIEHSWGAGIFIAKGFEFRVTQHFLFDRLGARDRNLGPADLGNNGPWGRYMTVGVHKSFGTRRW